MGTSAAIDLGVDLSRSIVYVQHDYFTRDLLWMIPFLMGISYVGSWLGKKLLNHIDETVFRKLVLFLIFSVGSVTLYQEISRIFVQN